MILKIYTEGKIVFEEQNAESITLPTDSGVITILEDHIALISKLTPGEIVIESKQELKDFFIEGGILKIKDNEIQLIVDLLQTEKDIVLDEVLKAKSAAEEALENPELITESEISKLQAIIFKEAEREIFVSSRRHSNTTAPESS